MDTPDEQKAPLGRTAVEVRKTGSDSAAASGALASRSLSRGCGRVLTRLAALQLEGRAGRGDTERMPDNRVAQRRRSHRHRGILVRARDDTKAGCCSRGYAGRLSKLCLLLQKAVEAGGTWSCAVDSRPMLWIGANRLRTAGIALGFNMTAFPRAQRWSRQASDGAYTTGCDSLDVLFDSRGSSPLLGLLAAHQPPCGRQCHPELTVTCPRSRCRWNWQSRRAG
jgi:hypothetical protein